MSRRKRTLIAIVVIELLLAGGWIWLHGMAMTSPHAAKDSPRVIGEVFGSAMGLVLALSPLLYLMARNNDRTAASAAASARETNRRSSPQSRA
jgi:hypothetical protein